MGGNRKAAVSSYHHHDNPKNQKQKKDKSTNNNRPSVQKAKGKAAAAQHHKSKAARNQQPRPPVIPFNSTDRILLVGEGDFSFALSLATHHHCTRMLATCYDAQDALYEKYPQSKEHVGAVQALAGGQEEETAKEAERRGKRKFDEVERPETAGDDDHREEKALGGTRVEGEADTQESNTTISKPKQRQQQQQPTLREPSVLFNIDARKLGIGLPGGGKTLRKGFPRHTTGGEIPGGGAWDVICFNFPHVGGLSTDVNRQVRSNQELLVSFFKAAAPLLSAPPPSLPAPPSPSSSSYSCDDDDDDDPDADADADDDDEKGNKPPSPTLRSGPGQILVTLFEGEPYTLWNIRDLARHSNLRVVRSFKFPWSSYPGYSHARTCGEIIGKHGGKGGWKGEDREARTYILERADWAPSTSAPGGEAKKRKKTKGKGNESDSE